MKPKRVIKVLVVLAILAGGAYAGWHFWLERPPADTDHLTIYGNVDHREVQLAFHATGRVEFLAVDEGDDVQAGQLLARVDPVRYQAALAKAKAEVAVREQELARLLAGSRPEEIAKARAEVAGAQATFLDAKRLYQRRKVLYQSHSIPRQELDNTIASLDAAKAQLDAAKEVLTLAVKGPREEDIAAARAALLAARAARDLAQSELADTSLSAPRSGVIRQRVLEMGDMAFPQTPVYTLAILDPVWVRAYVSETDLGKVKPGMAAEIFSDSYPGKSYPGWVGFISPTAEFTPKQVQTPELRAKLVYRLRVFACNQQRELRLGMPVTVRLDLASKPLAPLPNPDQRCGKR